MRRATALGLPALIVLGLGASVGGCSGGSSGGGGGSSSTTGASSASTSSQTQITGTFSALTYNVAGLPQGLSSSNPIANTPQIGPLLNAYDLVLVQEDFTYHHLLEPPTTHPYESAPLSQYSTLVNDGLNRFAWSPFTDFTRQRWQQCNGYFDQANDCLSSKGFSVARHELALGVVIDVYNLHADAGRSAGDNAARAAQFAQLAAFMSAFSAGNAVIVGGDTNLKESRPDDAQVLADFMNSTGLSEVGRTLSMPDHIDRFFYMDGLDVIVEPVRWRVADEFIDGAGNDLSDHPAIHVDFSYRRR